VNGLACAICGGKDVFSVGVCASCAAGDGNQQLVMVRPAVDRGAQSELQHALRLWLGSAGSDRGIAQTARGTRTLAIVPSAIAPGAVRAFERAGIATRALPMQQWPKALPASFITMIAAVAMVGELAGWTAAAMLLWTTPAIVVLLMTAAWLELRKPLVRFTRTAPALPGNVRRVIAAAITELPPGRTRGIILDLAAVGEKTFASLSPSFRKASLGQSVVELVSEAAALGLEINRLENIESALAIPTDTEQQTALNELRAGIEARVKLLGEARGLLARIAGNQAALEDGVASEVKRLVEQVRNEQRWRLEGEAAVSLNP
jgi:hypothetical protein